MKLWRAYTMKKSYKITKQINLIWGADRLSLNKGDDIEMTKEECTRWEERLGLKEIEEDAPECRAMSFIGGPYNELLKFVFSHEQDLDLPNRERGTLEQWVKDAYSQTAGDSEEVDND